MSYELAFKTSAFREWKKRGHTIQTQFKKKLAERLVNPHVPGAALSGAANVYKIKLRQAGYRLVYSVENETVTVTVTVTVIAVGKSNRNEIYDLALSRLQNSNES